MGNPPGIPAVGTSRARAVLRAVFRLEANEAGAGRFETAYHLLAAAMHLADWLGDDAALAEVERRATDRQRTLDLPPGPGRAAHHLSSAAAAKRGTVALFTSLSRILEATRARLHARAALGPHGGQTPP